MATATATATATKPAAAAAAAAQPVLASLPRARQSEVRRFIERDQALHERILLLQEVDVQQLHTRLQGAGIDCGAEEVS